jgi:hypothetical protein
MCHSARPATCGEFPLTVHVGVQIQVSVVLTCPGVDLSPLKRWEEGGPDETLSPSLRSEIEHVNEAVGQARAAGQLRWAAQRRRSVERRLGRDGCWQTEEEVRDALHDLIDTLIPEVLSDEEPPEAEDPLESLPMFYDPSQGRVAWRPHPGGVEFFSLKETGGIAAHLGVIASPTRSPGLTVPARALLRGYLAYLLDRDATINAAYDYLLNYEPGLPEEAVADDLELIAGQIIRLSSLRRALTSEQRGELSVQDVENGIRATDMDILDRPTAGVRL